jgi:hypothetical protein
MNVRCRGCQTEVSEWAALCPSCRRSLEDAELLPDPEPPPPPPADPAPVVGEPTDPWAEDGPEEEEDEGEPPSRRLARGRTAVLAGIAAVVLVGAAVGVAGLSRGGGHHQVRSGVSATQPNEAQVAVPHLPADLAGERLFFADPGMTGLYQTDGAELSKLRVQGDGFPLEPLVSGLGIIVYIHDNRAYRTSVGASGPTTDLGPATWIFPGLNGSIGIQNAVGPGPSTIRYMKADGTFDFNQRTTVLPANETAIAEVPLGLVIASGSDLSVPINEVGHLRISLVAQRKETNLQIEASGAMSLTPEFLGAATAVIGVHGATVAWIRCPGDESVNCSLVLLNTTNMYTRVVQEPPDSSGFAQGGGFSPDGGRLAVFVRSGISDGGSVLQLEVYDLATGALTPVGPALVADEPDGSATWSMDGLYLYFGGLLGQMYAEPATDIGSATKPTKLPLGASFSVVGY